MEYKDCTPSTSPAKPCRTISKNGSSAVSEFVVERSHNFDDHLSRHPPGLGVGECITHLVEPKDLVHQRSDCAAFHQLRDFSQLFSIGMHEKVFITGLVPPRCGQG